MSIRKQSPYGPFVERVMVPALRIGLLLLIVLAIGFGSWLETNESITDCSFKSSMSFHQVYLYRNITSNLTTPDSVSFGLWKSCYFYALNCSCTPTNLRYQPDVSTILQVATEHNAKPPLTTSSSLGRAIPLMLATVICTAALLIGVWANRRGKYMYRRIVVGLLTVTTLLVAIVFGWTYDQYFKMIKRTCKDRNNTIYCSRHAVGIEVVIFGMALGLLLIAFIFWFFSSSFFTKKEHLREQEEPFYWPFFGKQSSSEIPEMPARLRRPIPSMDKPSQRFQSPDELTIWRDVAAYDGDVEKKYYDYNQTDNRRKDSRGYQDYSKDMHNMSNEKVSLMPPPLITNTSPRTQQKPRVTSKDEDYYQQRQPHHNQRNSRRISTANNGLTPSPQKPNKHTNGRKKSSDSAMTFGGGGKEKRRKSSGKLISDLKPIYQQEYYQQRTPTNMALHPFHFPMASNDMMAGNSFCMTPFYNEDNGSSGSGSSGSGGNGGYYFQQHYQGYETPMQQTNPRRASNQYQVPVLNMPPPGADRHRTSSKKKITDQRIQSYLQKQQSSASNSSSSN